MSNAATHRAHALAAADLPKRISKNDVKRNRSTLAALASLGEGEFTADEVDAAHRGRSKYAQTRLWDLLAAGLVDGHGESSTYVYALGFGKKAPRPERFSITPLGRVALAC